MKNLWVLVDGDFLLVLNQAQLVIDFVVVFLLFCTVSSLATLPHT
jgi:hypothetical protein